MVKHIEERIHRHVVGDTAEDMRDVMMSRICLEEALREGIGVIRKGPGIQLFARCSLDLEDDIVLDLDVARNEFGFAVIGTRDEFGNILFVFDPGRKETKDAEEHDHHRPHQPFMLLEKMIEGNEKSSHGKLALRF